MRPRPPQWYPGVDFRGEGVFIQLHEPRVAEWEALPSVREMAARHGRAQRLWSEARGLDFQGPRPARYILLHSLSHMLIRQLSLDCGYRLDLVVEARIVVELKIVDRLAPVHLAQLLTYLRLHKRWLGLLINFNVPVLKDGILRRVLG